MAPGITTALREVLVELESETFEVCDIADLSVDAAATSTVSTSCCSCSTSGTCSSSCSTSSCA